jgi:regulation of enolase protein 1 (concanavalin A-like superfamily)
MIPYSEFKFTNVGAATKSGSAKFINNEIEIVAGGKDIWEKHDEFYFGYKAIRGDFDICVKIISLSAANLYTKAGIMARTDLSDSSQHVFYQVFPDNSPRNNNNGGCEFQYRSINTAEMKAIYPDSKTAGTQFNVGYPNNWIRLKRTGDLFESYFSKDNKNWKLYTSFSQKMPVELLVGLAVTAHNVKDFTTARFSELSFNPGK